MARKATGTMHTHTLADGTHAYHLRVPYRDERPRIVLHEALDCDCGCGGGWDERTARSEKTRILTRIDAGVWTPPGPSPTPRPADEEKRRRAQTFRAYADWWFTAKLSGAIGKRPIAPNTEIDYRWRLSHLKRFFGRYRLDQIDADLCQRFKETKLQEARELREALAAGADLRDEHGRRLYPLGLSSLKKLITTLAAILDEAIEDEKIERNPARGRRMQISVAKPRRTFLEADELAILTDAAAIQDRPLVAIPNPDELGATAAEVARLIADGRRPWQIARQLEITPATVTYHARRLGARVGRGYIGRRMICVLLGWTGVRVSELCDLLIGQIRLHDSDQAHFNIPDAKTETGVREVQMSPDLVNMVISHIDRMHRAGHPTGPEDHLVQNVRGGRLSRQRIAQIVTDATKLANKWLTARGLPPLPNTTPHTLRRTYISIALPSNEFDVKWVMSQVGHADSQMTMDVYAQLRQRADRTHGTNFDRLIRQGRQRLEVTSRQYLLAA